MLTIRTCLDSSSRKHIIPWFPPGPGFEFLDKDSNLPQVFDLAQYDLCSITPTNSPIHWQHLTGVVLDIIIFINIFLFFLLLLGIRPGTSRLRHNELRSRRST